MSILIPGSAPLPPGASGVPVGTIIAYCAPLKYLIGTGWELCDGGLISDPHSPFKNQTKPKLNDSRFLMGVSDDGAVNAAVGNNAVPAHSHTGTTIVAGAHGHGAHCGSTPNLTDYIPNISFSREGSPQNNHTHNISIDAAGDHTHGIVADGNSADGNIPAASGVYWIIRVR